MSLYLGSDPTNIQYGGGVRMYWQDKGADGWHEIGHFANLSTTTSINKDQLFGTRKARKAVIKTKTNEETVSISATALELSTENLRVALSAGAPMSTSQPAGVAALAEIQTVQGLYTRLPHRDAYIMRLLHATPTGTFQQGETVTGETSSATGQIGWAGDGFLELTGVTGEFRAGETLTGGTSSATARSTGVQKIKDLILVDAATPTKRYIQGQDYDFEADEGMLRVREGGAITGQPFAAYNYEEHKADVLYAMSGGTINKSVLIVTDRDNDGPRYEIFYPSVDWSINGDWAILTEDASNLPFEGTVLEDPTAPTSQKYGHVRLMR